MRMHAETQGCMTVSVGAVGVGKVDAIPLHPVGSFSVKDVSRGTFDVSSVADRISVTCCPVCEVSKGLYLRVAPVEPMWITMDFDITYFVKSNTDWMLN